MQEIKTLKAWITPHSDLSARVDDASGMLELLELGQSVDAMRAYEHGYANTVTGGSGAWDAAQEAAKGAPMMDKMSAGMGAVADDPSKFMTMQNAKGIAMPLYGSMTMNPSNQRTSGLPGMSSGNEYDGELFMDQRTFVPGLPGGIQRSRAVKRKAEGGITSVGTFRGQSNTSPIAAAALSNSMQPHFLPGMMSGRPSQPAGAYQPYVSKYAPPPGGRATIQPVNRMQAQQVAALEQAVQPPAPSPMQQLMKRNPAWDNVEVGGAAAGGSVGQYLRGPGDGMSDDIDATVHDTGEGIRVAANEFVIPADVVSHLGNGSSDAGAKILEEMGARVRAARTGNPKQGKQINASKFLPG